MGQALYRKYRSKRLDEIVGQEHITQSLRNALSHDRLSHAYLFTGPRGVGKTSVARILAHEIIQSPYVDDTLPIDILEIDAASNNGVDDARDLREKVYIAPVSAKYKVYIIDEVHMLSKAAFNALLKTLEEPPKHIVFILATTELHKLPETIVSRTQRYTFRPIETKKVISHLKEIAKKEDITISDEALSLIANHGGGSFRDSISLLDQASNSGSTIDLDKVTAILGLAPQTALTELYAEVVSGKPKDILERLSSLFESGAQASQIANQLSKFFRDAIISGADDATVQVYLATAKDLLDVPSSNNPDVYLELALIKANTQLSTQNHPSTLTPDNNKGNASLASAKTHTASPKHDQTSAVEMRGNEDVNEKSDQSRDSEAGITSAPPDPNLFWDDLLSALQKSHNTLYGVLKTALPEVDGESLVLNFKFAFHQKRINDSKNKQILSGLAEKILGHPIHIECRVNTTTQDVNERDASSQALKEEAQPVQKNMVDSISSVFGGAEVLES